MAKLAVALIFVNDPQMLPRGHSRYRGQQVESRPEGGDPKGWPLLMGLENFSEAASNQPGSGDEIRFEKTPVFQFSSKSWDSDEWSNTVPPFFFSIVS